MFLLLQLRRTYLPIPCLCIIASAQLRRPPAAITLNFRIETAEANLGERTAAVCAPPDGALPICAYWQAVSARMGQRPPCMKGAKQVRNTIERPLPGRCLTVRNWPGRAKAELKLTAINQSSNAAQQGKS